MLLYFHTVRNISLPNRVFSGCNEVFVCQFSVELRRQHAATHQLEYHNTCRSELASCSFYLIRPHYFKHSDGFSIRQGNKTNVIRCSTGTSSQVIKRKKNYRCTGIEGNTCVRAAKDAKLTFICILCFRARLNTQDVSDDLRMNHFIQNIVQIHGYARVSINR